MAGPWEKYQNTAPAAAKPWERYGTAAPAAPVSAPPPAPSPAAVAPAPAPAEEPNSILRALTLGTQDVGRGIAGLVGGPVDLATAGVNGVLGMADLVGLVDNPPYVSKPFMGSEFITEKTGDAVEGLGVKLYDEDERNWQERIISKALEYGTTGLTGAGALTKLGSSGPRMLQDFAEPYAKNAVRTATGDTAAGVGSGAGVGAYEETVPEAQRGPVGTISSALLGGLGGASLSAAGEGVAKATTNMVRKSFGGNVERSLPRNEMSGAPFTRAEADQAAERVQRQTVNPAVARRNIEEQVGDFDQFASRGQQPTVGAISDDVGLIQLENANRTTNSTPFILRDRAVNEKARDLLDSSAPADADGRKLTDFANEEVNRRLSAADADLAVARERAGVQAGLNQAEGDLSQYRGQGDPASRRIDEAFRGTLAEETARKNALYRDPALTGADVDPAPLVQAAADMRNSLGVVGDPASIPNDILTRIEGLAIRDENGAVTGYQPMTYGDVQDLRAQVSEAMTTAVTDSGRGASGSGPRVQNLRQLRQQLDGYIDTLAEGADGEGGPADAARAAIGNYRENFSPRFREGRAGEFAQAIKTDRYGTRTRPEDTANRFLNKGDDVESLDRAIDLRMNPDRAADARAVMMDRLAASGVRDARTGALRPDRLRKWRDDNAPVIERVPGLAPEIESILTRASEGERVTNGLADEVRQAELRAAQTQRETKAGGLGAIRDKDPVNAVGAVFKSGDPERAMKDVIKLTEQTPEAHAGLKAAVRDYLIDETTNSALQKTASGARPVSFAKLENFFDQNASTLAEVYSDEEMNALRRSHALLKPLGNLALRGTSGSDTAEKGKGVMRALEAGFKAKYGVLKGGGIMRTLRIALESLPNDKQNVDQLVKQMMFDPDLAMHLLARDVGSRIESPQWNAKLNRLIAYGAGVREDPNDGEEEPGPMRVDVRPRKQETAQ